MLPLTQKFIFSSLCGFYSQSIDIAQVSMELEMRFSRLTCINAGDKRNTISRVQHHVGLCVRMNPYISNKSSNKSVASRRRQKSEQCIELHAGKPTFLSLLSAGIEQECVFFVLADEFHAKKENEYVQKKRMCETSTSCSFNPFISLTSSW